MEHRVGPACDLSGRIILTDDQRSKVQNVDIAQNILKSSHTIAMVGLSTNPNKDSHMVAKFLIDQGFRVIPVHPKADQILGQKVYRKVTDIGEPVDIVNVFRPSEECALYAKQAVEIHAKAIWLQLNIYSEEAADIATDAGMDIVMNLCIKIEYNRLLANSDSH